MTLIQRELKAAYIGEYKVNPIDLLTNVVYYYSMKGDNNNYTGTAAEAFSITTGTVTYGTDYVTVTNAVLRNNALTYTNSAQTVGIRLNLSSFTELLSAGYDGNGASGWGLGVQKTAYDAVVSGSYKNGTWTLPTSSWHFAVTVFDGSSQKIMGYLDGVKIGEVSGGSTCRSTKGISIGRYGTGGSTITGNVGITFLTYSVISAENIQLFYEATKGTYGL